MTIKHTIIVDRIERKVYESDEHELVDAIREAVDNSWNCHTVSVTNTMKIEVSDD